MNKLRGQKRALSQKAKSSAWGALYLNYVFGESTDLLNSQKHNGKRAVRQLKLVTVPNWGRIACVLDWERMDQIAYPIPGLNQYQSLIRDWQFSEVKVFGEQWEGA